MLLKKLRSASEPTLSVRMLSDLDAVLSDEDNGSSSDFRGLGGVRNRWARTDAYSNRRTTGPSSVSSMSSVAPANFAARLLATTRTVLPW